MIFQVLSPPVVCKVERFELNGIKFNKPSEEENLMIKKYLKDLPTYCIVLDQFQISQCHITDDDTYISVVSAFKKFTKRLIYRSSGVTLKLLCTIFKVCLFYLALLLIDVMQKKREII